MGLFRLRHVEETTNKIINYLQLSTYLTIIYRMFRLIISISFITHFLACFWYKVAMIETETYGLEITWLNRYILIINFIGQNILIYRK